MKVELVQVLLYDSCLHLLFERLRAVSVVILDAEVGIGRNILQHPAAFYHLQRGFFDEFQFSDRVVLYHVQVFLDLLEQWDARVGDLS